MDAISISLNKFIKARYSYIQLNGYLFEIWDIPFYLQLSFCSCRKSETVQKYIE
jgi:hypothetical protein